MMIGQEIAVQCVTFFLLLALAFGIMELVTERRNRRASKASVVKLSEWRARHGERSTCTCRTRPAERFSHESHEYHAELGLARPHGRGVYRASESQKRNDADDQ